MIAVEDRGYLTAVAGMLRRKGAKVAFFSADAAYGAALAQSSGSRFYPCDTSDMEDVAKRVGELLEYWGGADVLVVSSPDVERVALKMAACRAAGSAGLRVVRIAMSKIREYAKEEIDSYSSANDCAAACVASSVNTVMADGLASPDSVARVALFLCDRKSEDIAGAIIPLQRPLL